MTVMCRKIILFFWLLFCALQMIAQQHSIAREWNELLLEAIRDDFARPTVHARNLFHTSVAMYDAWAAYDSLATPFFLGKTWNGFECPFEGIEVPVGMTKKEAQRIAISYAAYRILRHRFQLSPGGFSSIQRFREFMIDLRYDFTITDQDYSTNSPAALGNYIAAQIIEFGLQDGSNEVLEYENTYYESINPPLVMAQPGNPSIVALNRWQSLTLDVFIDQSGNVIPGATPDFLGPEWGRVASFALQEDDLTIHQRDGNNWWVYHDPGTPPLIKLESNDQLSEAYKMGFALVSIWGAHLDPADTVMWDISPASIGNNPPLPTNMTEVLSFYNLLEGGDQSAGHEINPITGQPYEPQMVPRGDYTRVLAEFWADGPDSETPPGHWFTILNYVNDHPLMEKRYAGQGSIVDELEWDVKAYLTLGGAMHDAAISAWGVKGFYDYVRPVSAIRGMAERGQSSDPDLPNFDIAGIPLVDGYIELVTADDPLAGFNGQHVDKIKLYTWRGPDYVVDPLSDVAGVGWILAENWWPYQRPSFVTPPFAGYVSGHSTFSRAAAEVLTALTGDPFFPGGMGSFDVEKNEFLVFEDGPSQNLTLQWATYKDASDQTSLSRIWGGIHPPADDIPGRLIGIEVGNDAFAKAKELFNVDKDNDGYIVGVDCDDLDPGFSPGQTESCDGIDNDCDGLIDEFLPIYTYYLDFDQDGYGDPAISIDTCALTPPAGYADNNLDCNDQDSAFSPDAIEKCDGVDNNCDGRVSEGFARYTYYVDADSDGYGNPDILMDTCLSYSPVGYAANALDCDDQNSAVNPGLTEICDDLDNNCDGRIAEGLVFYTYFFDADQDGVGDSTQMLISCLDLPPNGYVEVGGDCDDRNAMIRPGSIDEPDNYIDEDCNGFDEKEKTTIVPNPFRDQVTIYHPFEGIIKLNIYHINGQKITQLDITFMQNQSEVDLAWLQRGTFIFEGIANANTVLFRTKIVKL